MNLVRSQNTTTIVNEPHYWFQVQCCSGTYRVYGPWGKEKFLCSICEGLMVTYGPFPDEESLNVATAYAGS